MWLIATAKNGISSVELGRRLGIKQTNASAQFDTSSEFVDLGCLFS